VLRRIGFLAGLAVAATATCALVLALAAPSMPAAAVGCGSAPDAPEAVASAFVRTAVLRVDPGCSFDLVTPALRQGMTRREWSSGTIPVQPYPTALLDTLEIVTRVYEDGVALRAAWVDLSSADLGAWSFELVLERRDGRWLVSYWAPRGMVGVPAAD
jgi:hypothetical protein